MERKIFAGNLLVLGALVMLGATILTTNSAGASPPVRGSKYELSLKQSSQGKWQQINNSSKNINLKWVGSDHDSGESSDGQKSKKPCDHKSDKSKHQEHDHKKPCHDKDSKHEKSKQPDHVIIHHKDHKQHCHGQTPAKPEHHKKHCDCDHQGTKPKHDHKKPCHRKDKDHSKPNPPKHHKKDCGCGGQGGGTTTPPKQQPPKQPEQQPSQPKPAKPAGHVLGTSTTKLQQPSELPNTGSNLLFVGLALGLLATVAGYVFRYKTLAPANDATE